MRPIRCSRREGFPWQIDVDQGPQGLEVEAFARRVGRNHESDPPLHRLLDFLAQNALPLAVDEQPDLPLPAYTATVSPGAAARDCPIHFTVS